MFIWRILSAFLPAFSNPLAAWLRGPVSPTQVRRLPGGAAGRGRPRAAGLAGPTPAARGARAYHRP
jgi:hypothetical protein